MMAESQTGGDREQSGRGIDASASAAGDMTAGDDMREPSQPAVPTTGANSAAEGDAN